jgi:hypothetical protein
MLLIRHTVYLTPSQELSKIATHNNYTFQPLFHSYKIGYKDAYTTAQSLSFLKKSC